MQKVIKSYYEWINIFHTSFKKDFKLHYYYVSNSSFPPVNMLNNYSHYRGKSLLPLLRDT